MDAVPSFASWKPAEVVAPTVTVEFCCVRARGKPVVLAGAATGGGETVALWLAEAETEVIQVRFIVMG